MKKLRVLDLFSGIGGFSLGLERTGGFETVAFCEINSYCQRVLKKHWPHVPVFSDIKKIRGEYHGLVDVITGGYPCQGESTAGRRKGAEDDRWLWPEMFACVKTYRPTWVIGENVLGHVTMGLDTVLTDLASEAYSAQAFIIPACARGAWHRRDRVWVIAHNDGALRLQQADQIQPRGYSPDDGSDAADTNRKQYQGASKAQRRQAAARFPDTDSAAVQDAQCLGRQEMEQNDSRREDSQGPTGAALQSAFDAFRARGWPVEPAVGRVADGVPNRVDRLTALGNTVIPDIPEAFGHAILETYRCSP